MSKRILCAVTAILLTGCSAQYWGGDTAGQRPGIKVQKNLFGTSAEMTSDGTGELDELSFSKDDDGERLKVTGLKVDQSASDVVAEEPAKLAALADLQHTQVEYIKAVGTIVTDVARVLAPILKMITAGDIIETASGCAVEYDQPAEKVESWINQANDYIKLIEQIDMTPATQPSE